MMMTRRRALVFGGIVAGVGAVIFCVGVVVWAVMRGRGPVPETWDFSRDFRVARVAWPRDVGDTMYARYGDFDFRLIWPTGKVLHERAFFLAADREGAEVSHLTIHFALHSTLEEVCSHAHQIMMAWGFPQTEIDRLEKLQIHLKTPTEPLSGAPTYFGPFVLGIQTSGSRNAGEERSWSMVAQFAAPWTLPGARKLAP